MSTTPTFVTDLSLCIANINSRSQPSPSPSITSQLIPGYLPDSSYAIQNTFGGLSSQVYSSAIASITNIYITSALCIDNSGNLYFASGYTNGTQSGNIYIYIKSTKNIVTISRDINLKSFSNPTCIAIDNNHNYFYVVTWGISRAQPDGSTSDGYNVFQYTIDTSKTDSSIITYRQTLNSDTMNGNTSFSGANVDNYGNLYIGSRNSGAKVYYYGFTQSLSSITNNAQIELTLTNLPSYLQLFLIYGLAFNVNNDKMYLSFAKTNSYNDSNSVLSFNLSIIGGSNPSSITASNPIILFSQNNGGETITSGFFPLTLCVDPSNNLYITNSNVFNYTTTYYREIYYYNLTTSTPSSYKKMYIGNYGADVSYNYNISGITSDPYNNIYFYANPFDANNAKTSGNGIGKLNPNNTSTNLLTFVYSSLPLQIGNIPYSIQNTYTGASLSDAAFTFQLYSGTITLSNPSYYTGNTTLTIYYKTGFTIGTQYTLKSSLGGSTIGGPIQAVNANYIAFPSTNLLGPTAPYYLYDSTPTLKSVFYQDYVPLVVGQNGSLVCSNGAFITGLSYILLDASYGHIVSEAVIAQSNTLSFTAVNLEYPGTRNYLIYVYYNNAPRTSTGITLSLNATQINTFPETIYANSSCCIYFKNSSLFIKGGSYTLVGSGITTTPKPTATASADPTNSSNTILSFNNLFINPGTATYNIYYNDTGNNFPGLDPSFSVLSFTLNPLPVISGILSEIAVQNSSQANFTNGRNYVIKDSLGNNVSDIVTYSSNIYYNLTFTGVNANSTTATTKTYSIYNNTDNLSTGITLPVAIGTIVQNSTTFMTNGEAVLTFSHPYITFSSSYGYTFNNSRLTSGDNSNTITFNRLNLNRGYFLYNIICDDISLIVASLYFNSEPLFFNQPCKHTLNKSYFNDAQQYYLLVAGTYNNPYNFPIVGGTYLQPINNTVYFSNLTLPLLKDQFGNPDYGSIGRTIGYYVKEMKYYDSRNSTPNLGSIFLTYDYQGTIITNPTPLIQQQPGTIMYYDDISYNNGPINSNTYLLQDASGNTLSSFTTSPTGEIVSNYQNYIQTPGAIAFDLYGNLFITNVSTNYITAYNPNFSQYSTSTISSSTYAINPFGIKFYPGNGALFFTCLGNSPNTYSPFGSIYKAVTPNYNYQSESALPTFTKVFNYNSTYYNRSTRTSQPFDASYSTYCNYPYDIEIDNSGNLLVSNFGTYTNGGNTSNGFISKLFINAGFVNDAAVIISSVSSATTSTKGGNTIDSILDSSLNYPSGMAYDLSNNYLYVANVTNTTFSSASITMYDMTDYVILGRFQTGFVGNVSAGNNNAGSQFGSGGTSRPITSLKIDNYNNIYYLYYNGINTCVNVIKPYQNTTISFSASLIYSHVLVNISDNSSYGLTFYNGNIYVAGNVSSEDTNIVEIQTSYKFDNVSLTSGNRQLELINSTNLNPTAHLYLNVPSSNLLLSNVSSSTNINRYTNQASILTYYDNPNSANSALPIGGGSYELVNQTNTSNQIGVTIVNNNEEVYATYPNELGNLDYPISMDFDALGNLYVLNAPSSTSGSTSFITIITPNSGNFGKSYYPNVTFINPSCIRYNQNDGCMYVGTYGTSSFGNIYKIITTITETDGSLEYNLEFENFYSNDSYCRNPIDIVFDNAVSTGTGFGASSLGNMYISNYATITISKIPLTYENTFSPPNRGTVVTTGAITLATLEYLNFRLSGIAVDSTYVYVVNTSDLQPNYISANIAQLSNSTPNTLIQYWNAGYVGKKLDTSTNTFTSPIHNISSTLKFDAYKNLYYIYSYTPTGSTNPVVNVQAFVPNNGLNSSGGSSSPVFIHTMSTNPTQQVYALALYNGDVFVAQYNANTIVKIINTFSFGNYGFGVNGSQSDLILYNQNNLYNLEGGNSTIYDISANANVLNYAFDGAVVITNPNPCIANCPGTLYYYDNPATTSPEPNTTYVLKNSSSKVVSDNYTTPPGNETTIIYNNLSKPNGITTDSQGYLYIANSGNSNTYPNGSIVKSTISGQTIFVKNNNYIKNPYAIEYNPIDGFIYYANTTPTLFSGVSYFYVYKMSTDGNTFTIVYQDSNFNYLYNPQDIAFDLLGNIYISNGYTTTASGSPVNGSITKISLSYPSGVATPYNEQVFSNYLTGLTLNSSSNVILSGLAIDKITNYAYVVSGANDASGNNINISQIPLSGNDAGNVCRKWQTGKVGNLQEQTALSFDNYGNLYYYYYDTTAKIGYLKGFNPYTNTSATYSHTLLGGATSGAYGMVYYNGNFYSSQSAYNSTTQTYIDNVIEINASYYFTGVTLQAGQNVLSINTTITNEVIISNIVASASTPKYYTIPAPPVAGQPAQLIFEYDGVVTPINGHNYVVVDTNMNYVSSILNYNSATEPNSYTFTFNNLVLPGGANYLYIFDITTGQIVNIPLCNSTNGYIFIKIPIVCFYKGTKILCAINGKDTYVPIEKIGQGTLVKTYKQGYKRVKYNVMGKLNNTKEHSIDKLFKLSKKRFPNLGLTEDLYVTGSHALLHDSLNEREVILMKKVIQYAASNYKSIYNAKIEDKYKLLAYHDERFEEIMMNSVFEIYHIVLENENENFNYGIYANGVLAESTDELTLMRMKGFEKINKTPETLEKFVNAMNTNKYPSQLRRALNK
jgi:hypothetical protein